MEKFLLLKHVDCELIICNGTRNSRGNWSSFCNSNGNCNCNCNISVSCVYGCSTTSPDLTRLLQIRPAQHQRLLDTNNCREAVEKLQANRAANNQHQIDNNKDCKLQLQHRDATRAAPVMLQQQQQRTMCSVINRRSSQADDVHAMLVCILRYVASRAGHANFQLVTGNLQLATGNWQLATGGGSSVGAFRD
ncbi:hypothetical protein ACLKA7_007453 [Drosophila subpalustris]